MPTRATRIGRRFDRWLPFAVLLLAVVAIVAGTGAYVDQRSADRSTDRIQASRAGCERNLTDRAEGIQRDLDINEFALAAAAARREAGQEAVARKYEQIAARARIRQRSARTRMLGADPMPDRIADAAPKACAIAYPLP